MGAGIDIYRNFLKNEVFGARALQDALDIPHDDPDGLPLATEKPPSDPRGGAAAEIAEADSKALAGYLATIALIAEVLMEYGLIEEGD